MESPRVGFLIGGAQKAGTTALARFLSSHPALALPVGKEAHVFDAPDFDEGWSVADIDGRYASHFEPADDAHLAGDATPIYLFHPRLVERIHRYNPAMRWIVLLRHPVDRAISQYHMERERGLERWPFWAAMLLERWRLRGHEDDFSPASPLRLHSYRARGDYAAQLDALYARFPADQVLLLTNEALANTPVECLDRVCAFLRVPPLTVPAAPPRVFEGKYARLSRQALRWRLLAWLMRRELAALRDRFGLSL
jgi:hypothetical protein